MFVGALSIVKTIVEIVAYFSAFLFFAFKAWSGYFITNMSVRISCSRQRDISDRTADLLTVTLILLKGDLGSVQIHDIQVRNNGFPIPEMEGLVEGLGKELWRLQDQRDTDKPGEPTRVLCNWSHNESRPFVNLGPSEETQLSWYCKVKSGEVCKIDVVIAGRPVRTWPATTCQWRISAVSLPPTTS